MKKFTLKQLALSALIAALYVALTVPLGGLASDYFINVRPAEALTLLPVFFVEAVPGLAVGCLLANLLTGATAMDVILGAVITLAAAVLTRLVRKPLIGGIFPVVLNALGLPLIWMFSGGATGYWTMVLSTLLTQTIWVYGLGIPLCLAVRRSRFLMRFATSFQREKEPAGEEPAPSDSQPRGV